MTRIREEEEVNTTTEISGDQHRGGVSATTITQFRVPQNSVLAPILFVVHTADVVRITQQQNLNAHQYAVDTQVHGSCCPGIQGLCWFDGTRRHQELIVPWYSGQSLV